MSIAPRGSDPRTATRPTTASDRLIQFVTPQGAATLQGEAHGIDLPLAHALYRDMVLARRFDAEALALQRQGELNLWLMSWGQEAAQVGSIRALRDSDMVFPSYREHAAALCRGLSPTQLLTQWRGCSHSGWDPTTYRFHIYSLVLGTQTLHATGFAAGAAMEGTDEVVAVYFGFCAAGQGVSTRRSLGCRGRITSAVLLPEQPVGDLDAYVHANGGAATSRHTAGFGLHTYHVDGNDVLAVHAVTSEAAEHIRADSGPVLIEAQTYRRGGHSSSDDPDRYRDADETDSLRVP